MKRNQLMALTAAMLLALSMSGCKAHSSASRTDTGTVPESSAASQAEETAGTAEGGSIQAFQEKLQGTDSLTVYSIYHSSDTDVSYTLDDLINGDQNFYGCCMTGDRYAVWLRDDDQPLASVRYDGENMVLCYDDDQRGIAYSEPERESFEFSMAAEEDIGITLDFWKNRIDALCFRHIGTPVETGTIEWWGETCRFEDHQISYENTDWNEPRHFEQKIRLIVNESSDRLEMIVLDGNDAGYRLYYALSANEDISLYRIPENYRIEENSDGI